MRGTANTTFVQCVVHTMTRLTQFMKDQGIPWEPCAHQPDTTVVFSFPSEVARTSSVD